jgi:hypothetical protein
MSTPTPHEESVNHKNLVAAVAYTKATRALLREFEDRLDAVVNVNQQLRAEMAGLRVQVSALQVKMFSGGATS